MRPSSNWISKGCISRERGPRPGRCVHPVNARSSHGRELVIQVGPDRLLRRILVTGLDRGEHRFVLQLSLLPAARRGEVLDPLDLHDDGRDQVDQVAVAAR